jgi:hypothetical protein
MQFTFNSKFVGFGSPSTTVEFEADALQDVLEKFADFLRGSGYHFDGYLDVVPFDEDIPEMPEYPFMDEALVNTASAEWQAVVNSLMNPPKFRANDEKDVYGGSCPECGISKVEMRGHKCWDKRCPLPESAVNAN